MKKIISKQAGFSLLEILITLVVISVGVLGLTGLKLIAIKGENESHFRHEASLLMMDLADRIRTNVAGVDNGDYAATGGISIADDGIPAKDCNTAACNSTELARFDKYAVAKNISRVIPGSSVSISCPNACKTIPETATTAEVKQLHTIKVTWKEKKQKEEDSSLDDENHNGAFHIRHITFKVMP